MELRNKYILIIGLIVVVSLIIFNFVKKSKYAGGKKLSNMFGIEESAYYKRKIVLYKFLSFAITSTYVVEILLCFFMLAGPYKKEVGVEEKYSRDIILTMDISTSVNELNLKLVDELQETVDELQGERFGIVIFNTSGVMICPLTDDYEYVTEVLDQLKVSIEQSISQDYDAYDDYIYNSDYLFSGTLVGNIDRGSSIIGDGLATSACDFPDQDEQKTRIIIFSTDNDLQGDPIFTLDEATDLCVDKNITVFGIGTKEMYDEKAAEMKSAVERTGGKFYMEEDEGNVKDIVDNINKEGKNLVKGKTIEKEIPLIEIPAIILFITFALQIVLAKVLKK